MLYRLGENVPRFVEIIASIKQAIDFRAVTGPFLDFGEVARIGDQRLRRTNRPSCHQALDALQRQHV